MSWAMKKGQPNVPRPRQRRKWPNGLLSETVLLYRLRCSLNQPTANCWALGRTTPTMTHQDGRKFAFGRLPRSEDLSRNASSLTHHVYLSKGNVCGRLELCLKPTSGESQRQGKLEQSLANGRTLDGCGSREVVCFLGDLTHVDNRVPARTQLIIRDSWAVGKAERG